MEYSYTHTTLHGDVMTPQELYERKQKMRELLETEQEDESRLTAKSYMRINANNERTKLNLQRARDIAAQKRADEKKQSTADDTPEVLAGLKKKVVVAEGE